MCRIVIPALAACLSSPQTSPSDSQPLFTYTDAELAANPTWIAYGDMRFTDPKETTDTNPTVRKSLVDRIAEERPDAVLLSGDVPWHGGDPGDYAQYRLETEPWRAAKIRVLPALGNQELNGNDPAAGLENWWTAFPALRGRRWYSVRLGSRIAILNLDSNSTLVPGSEQARWITAQMAVLPSSVKFVLFNMHHPPVADFQTGADADHNARPSEIALADLLKTSPPRSRIRFIVCAGHIHNYERFLRDRVTHLVSGGAGAKPRPIVRGEDDLFRDTSEVNYHYVKFVLRGNTITAEMVRLADPTATTAKWEVKDHFQIIGL